MSKIPERLTIALADRYTIERELGAGGMATVYLAHDVKHDRNVAVKVLRPELAAVLGAERFLNEIRVTANLQHPHILALYDSGAADGFLFYVMPYVPGETLGQRLGHEKQLGVEEAVRLAAEIASALYYAHRQGVIHRDIKPANVLLQDGEALVADFGIALALKAAGGDRLTETGLSLGTPHYMSPEQAMGDRDVDARSDVYALGAMLYEMLAGEPPHSGHSIQAILSRVLTEDPRPLIDLRLSVPTNVAMAVEKALAKVPADRFASAADFAKALKDPGFTLAYSAARTRRTRRTTAQPARASGRDWRPWPMGAGLVLVAAVAAVVGRMTAGAPPPERTVVRFRIPVEAERGLTGAPVNTLALSPDGQTIVYVGRAGGAGGTQLFQRQLDELEAHPIPGTSGASFPIFSPDGTRIAYFSTGGMSLLAVAGGSATSIPNVPSQALAQAVWLNDQAFVATNADGSLVQVGLDGVVSTIALPDTTAGERFLGVHAVLPDGKTILAIGSSGGANGSVLMIDAETGEREILLEAATNAVWYADESLLWAQPGGALLGAPFDPRARRLGGMPVTLAEGVRLAVGGPAQVAVSATGSMVYIPEQPFTLMEVDRSGRRETIAEGRRFHSPRYAPDGRRLAVDFTHQGSRDVWTVDLRQRTLTRISFEDDGHDPIWTPDGRWITYIHDGGIWRRRADGSGMLDSLYVRSALTGGLEYTADGKLLLTAPTGTSGDFDLGMMPLDEDEREQDVLLSTPFNEQMATVSPNGRWLAYVSDETGLLEVYMRPFPEGGAKMLVSQGGGTEPRWSPDGATIYYQGRHEELPYLIAVAVGAGAEFTVGDRTPLFDVSEFEPSAPHANYDISPDGTRFAMVYQGPLSEMVFVLNWTEEVRRGSGR